MKTVDFRRTADKRSYFCMCGLVDSLCKINHKGVYVLANEAAERERVLAKKWEALDSVLRKRDNQLILLVGAVEDALKEINGMEKMRGSSLHMLQEKLDTALAQVKE